MIQRVRLTEKELKGILRSCVVNVLKNKTALQEARIDLDREITLAQKELMKMSSPLSEIGLRLEGTQFYNQYKQMRDAIVELNNSIIKYIKNRKK
jgi:hypothetical protein